jgi:hypothetical protein
MDGRVLTEIFSEPHEVRFEEINQETAELVNERGFDDEEAAQVEERLRGLGYL